MKLKHVKKLLMDEIRKVSQSVEQYCNNPLKDFTRTRKLPIEKLMFGIIGMGSGSITNELIDYYDISPDAPTASAFVQQRDKLNSKLTVRNVKTNAQMLIVVGKRTTGTDPVLLF